MWDRTRYHIRDFSEHYPSIVSVTLAVAFIRAVTNPDSLLIPPHKQRVKAAFIRRYDVHPLMQLLMQLVVGVTSHQIEARCRCCFLRKLQMKLHVR